MTVFQRSVEVEARRLRPGEYIQFKGTDYWVLYKCPKCGFVTSLGKKHHHVQYDGLVSPKAACPHKLGGGNRCSFSSDIILDGWLPETKGNA